MQFDTIQKLEMLKTFPEFRKKLKNGVCVTFNFPNKTLFNFSNEDIIYLPYLKFLNTKQKETLYMELFILNMFGYVKIVRKPKKNELCYFWNGQDKMKATKDKKPFIEKFSETICMKNSDKFNDIDIKYSPKNCNWIFSHCEPLENPYIV